MKAPAVRDTVALIVSLGLLPMQSRETCGQVAEDRGFKAVPRPIHYETPLAPRRDRRPSSSMAVRPAGRKGRRNGAEGGAGLVGVKLELADDRTVTSEETWLLTEAYRKTPLIVLGNARTTASCTRWASTTF